MLAQDFPGGPVVKTPCFQCRDATWIPGEGTKITPQSLSIFSVFTFSSWFFSGEGHGTPLQYSCLENPMDGGAWWAAVHGVAKSWM